MFQKRCFGIKLSKLLTFKQQTILLYQAYFQRFLQEIKIFMCLNILFASYFFQPCLRIIFVRTLILSIIKKMRRYIYPFGPQLSENDAKIITDVWDFPLILQALRRTYNIIFESQEEKMNICINFIDNDEVQIIESEVSESHAAKRGKRRLNPLKASNQAQEPKGRYVKNAWNKSEKKKYLCFLRKNIHLFSYSLAQRKRQKINVMMSQAIKSRTAAKCHSYHQKMMLKYKTIQNIIECCSEQNDKKMLMSSSGPIDPPSCLDEQRIRGGQFLGEQYFEYTHNQPAWMQYLDLDCSEEGDNFLRIQSQQQ